MIIRGSGNIQADARTKLSTIMLDALLQICVGSLPALLKRIPLSAVAAILLMTGVKRASPWLFADRWSHGRAQFLPFALTVGAIILTELLVGIAIGLLGAMAFILSSSMRRPVRRFSESHIGGNVLRLELANQVSFLNRAALIRTLDEVPTGGHVMLDATQSE